MVHAGLKKVLNGVVAAGQAAGRAPEEVTLIAVSKTFDGPDIVPVIEPPLGGPSAGYDVVGPVCETGDTFAKGRGLPLLAEGDLVAFRSAGAYGAVMASEYNTRPLIPEVLVQGDHFAVIRARPTFDEILARDNIPEWL